MRLNELEEQWSLPPAGWVKLNTDGAYSSVSPGIASGGILRDEHGGFLKAFMFKGEEGDSLTSELWGCLHGLKLAWDMGVKNVILEIDSADAVELLRNPVNETHEDYRLVKEVKRVIDREWTVEVRLISRWVNTVADHLAKASLTILPGFQAISFPEMELARLIEDEKG